MSCYCNDPDFSSDIIGSTQDGAPMVVSYVNKIKPWALFCLIHRIHLAVTNVFYTTRKLDQ